MNTIQEGLCIFLEQLKALGVESLYLPPGLLQSALPSSVEEQMKEMEAGLQGCQRCKLHKARKSLVFGAGNVKADLVFVGEGPGEEEDKQGIPFVGRAGELLTKMIENGMGLKRSDVYICNVVKCRPPGNRNPEEDEIAACEPFLLKQLDCIQPKVIVALGKFAAQTLLQTATPISKLRGNWHTYHGIKVMPTFHPSYLLRPGNEGEKKKVWDDLKFVMAELGLRSNYYQSSGAS